jgi:hypothetical protein
MNSLDAHDVAARSANNFAFSFTKEKTSAMLREFADRIDAREIIVQNVVTKQTARNENRHRSQDREQP